MFGRKRRCFVSALRNALFCFGVLGLSSLAFAQDATKKTPQPSPAAEKAGSSRPTDRSTAQSTASGAGSAIAKSPEYDPAQYKIGSDDQLMISVWREPELSLSVVVRPDGMITLPLVNDVNAAGLKPLELQSLLIEKLKPFVNEPQVTVVVQAIKSRQVLLTGQGAKTGVFPLTGRMTVLELLAQTGGLGPFAKTKSIYVLRSVNGQQTRIHFNYKDAISGKPNSNIFLEPGDIVVVP
jgi:polysaccharide export outer membrane protein